MRWNDRALQSDVIRQAFVFEKIAVIVGSWFEPETPPERGARVEVRLLDAEPPRGTFSAAERVVIDRPLFRADLFDRMDQPVGNLGSAHFHSRFEGIEPCDREWPPAIRRDPTGWLAGELGDLRALVERSGLSAEEAKLLDDDADALRAAVPQIIDAVEAAWRVARA